MSPSPGKHSKGAADVPSHRRVMRGHTPGHDGPFTFVLDRVARIGYGPLQSLAVGSCRMLLSAALFLSAAVMTLLAAVLILLRDMLEA